MRSAGIDIGSRTVKLAIVRDNELIYSGKKENSFNPQKVCTELLQGQSYDRIVATGYGRHLFGNQFKCGTISEIKAFALGCRHLAPSTRTILDIGGQDVKVISLDDSGQMARFEMNDKCAAGTGRFLEIMAMALGYTLTDFSEVAGTAPKAANINSMCTVFAESEVISSVAAGDRRDEIALGIHRAVVNRVVQMLKRIGVEDDLLFVGGVAYNSCIRELLQRDLNRQIQIPEDPQIVGALGCALAASTELQSVSM